MSFDYDRVALIAQKISFAFEDLYSDENKRNLFIALLDKYLLPVVPEADMEVYEAIIQLGKKEPDALDRMVKELKDMSLISE